MQVKEKPQEGGERKKPKPAPIGQCRYGTAERVRAIRAWILSVGELGKSETNTQNYG